MYGQGQEQFFAFGWKKTMNRRFPNHLGVLGFLLLGMLPAGHAQARVEERLAYTKNQSYQAALRYLRVDHGYTVVEKDQESGYLLFEYPKRDNGFTQGSIQVVERQDTVAVIVQLPTMPSYHERLLIEGLLKKIREDYGAPPQKKRVEGAPEDPQPDPDENEPDPPAAPDETPKKDSAKEAPKPK